MTYASQSLTQWKENQASEIIDIGCAKSISTVSTIDYYYITALDARTPLPGLCRTQGKTVENKPGAISKTIPSIIYSSKGHTYLDGIHCEGSPKVKTLSQGQA